MVHGKGNERGEIEAQAGKAGKRGDLQVGIVRQTVSGQGVPTDQPLGAKAEDRTPAYPIHGLLPELEALGARTVGVLGAGEDFDKVIFELNEVAERAVRSGDGEDDQQRGHHDQHRQAQCAPVQFSAGAPAEEQRRRDRRRCR